MLAIEDGKGSISGEIRISFIYWTGHNTFIYTVFSKVNMVQSFALMLLIKNKFRFPLFMFHMSKKFPQKNKHDAK